MKYRLKARELQKKLDDISNGAFSKALNISVQRLIDVYQQDGLDFNLDTDRVFVDFGNDVKLCTQKRQFRACFEPDTIEQYEEYNPKAWNKYPEVEPPEGVWMRCVMTDIHHNNRIVRVGAKFSAGAWRDHEGVAFEPRFRVDKFRPWDEDEESK